MVNNNDMDVFSSLVDLTVSTLDAVVPLDSPSNTASFSEEEIDEMEFLRSCRGLGVVHILGNTVVKARRGSSFPKRIAIDYVYAFLKNVEETMSSSMFHMSPF